MKICVNPSHLFLSFEGSTQLAASLEFMVNLLILPCCVFIDQDDKSVANKDVNQDSQWMRWHN